MKNNIEEKYAEQDYELEYYVTESGKIEELTKEKEHDSNQINALSEKFIALLEKKDEQMDRLIGIIEKNNKYHTHSGRNDTRHKAYTV